MDRERMLQEATGDMLDSKRKSQAELTRVYGYLEADQDLIAKLRARLDSFVDYVNGGAHRACSRCHRALLMFETSHEDETERHESENGLCYGPIYCSFCSEYIQLQKRLEAAEKVCEGMTHLIDEGTFPLPQTEVYGQWREWRALKDAQENGEEQT